MPFGCTVGSPLEQVPTSDQIRAPSLSAPVDVLRDREGIPHIYGQSLADVAYVQGYVMAEDRLIQLDLARRSASGTLAEIAGAISPSLIDTDISMRVHHLRSTSQKIWDLIQADSDPEAKILAGALTAYAAGVNAYVADLVAGKYELSPVFALAYDATTWVPWSEVDSIVIGHLITYQLSYDDAEIFRSALAKAASTAFANTQRAAMGDDLLDLRPFDPTYTLPGDFSTLQPITTASAISTPEEVLLGAWKHVRTLGHSRVLHPEDGSNNFVVGPQLSATGHTLVANDPHLSLQNPPTFYLCHLVVSDPGHPVDVMGAQFPGAPGVILGMNRHVAWAATTSNLDDTDVYEETITTCNGGPCATFNGQQVPLTSRVETINVGKFGNILRTVQAQLWDVPHHGPILPRINTDHSTQPLGASELSVRWTGHEPTLEVRALLGLDTAASVTDAEKALESYFKTGGENWVLGDDQGHFGWTEATRVPRRPDGTKPWLVMPGDGSAEWQNDLDLMWVPHAFDPAKGYLATANADPIGVTDDGEPFASEPVVDGSHLYIGFNFDPGTRVGRISKRLDALIAQKGKLTLDDLQSVQADDVSEWNQPLAPTFLDAAQAINEEIASPGTHMEISALVAQSDTLSRQAIGMVHDAVAAWQFDTPADSFPALVFAVWVTRLADLALGDEKDILPPDVSADIYDDLQLKLLARMAANPTSLKTPLSTAGDNILWDDVTTPAIESKRQIAAKAIFDMLDYLLGAVGKDPHQWSWGQLHTITLAGLLPLDALQIPLKTDAMFPNGFPRHGDNGTVDVGEHGMAVDSFGYNHGPVIRAVYELDPSGTKSRNALPGGEVWNPMSPHYRDLMEYWRQNQTFDMAFATADVLKSAFAEIQANGGGRVRFAP